MTDGIECKLSSNLSRRVKCQRCQRRWGQYSSLVYLLCHAPFFLFNENCLFSTATGRVVTSSIRFISTCLTISGETGTLDHGLSLVFCLSISVWINLWTLGVHFWTQSNTVGWPTLCCRTWWRGKSKLTLSLSSPLALTLLSFRAMKDCALESGFNSYMDVKFTGNLVLFSYFWLLFLSPNPFCSDRWRTGTSKKLPGWNWVRPQISPSIWEIVAGKS